METIDHYSIKILPKRSLYSPWRVPQIVFLLPLWSEYENTSRTLKNSSYSISAILFHDNIHDVIRIKMRICVRQMNDWKRANIRVSVGVNLFFSLLACLARCSKTCTERLKNECSAGRKTTANPVRSIERLAAAPFLPLPAPTSVSPYLHLWISHKIREMCSTL